MSKDLTYLNNESYHIEQDSFIIGRLIHEIDFGVDKKLEKEG